MARCIAVLGASHVGKSTLVDRLCELEGRPPRPAEPYELRCVPFRFLDQSWTALDCPGSLEFIQDAADALLVADAALIVVSPDPEQAVLAAPYIRLVESSGVPHFIVVNKMDEAHSRLRDIAAALQAYSSSPIVLRQIPIRECERFAGAVDLFSERAWKYRDGAQSALIEIPEDLMDREQEARDEMLESLSEYDDWLLEEIIEEKHPQDSPVYAICARVLAENRVTEAFIASAEHRNGVTRLMKALRHETPPPAAARDRLGGAPAAVSFLARHRKHVGKTTFLRVFGEGLKAGDTLGGGGVGMLSDAGSDKPAALAEVEEGGVAAALKSDHLVPARLYTAQGGSEPPAWRAVARPLLHRALRPVHERDDVKLSEAIATIAGEDTGLTVSQDPESGAQVVGVQGALHLRRLRENLAEVFGVEAEDYPVATAFRETISRRVETHYRHKKQSGGAGQFADVKLTVAPSDRSEGFLFDQTVKGGAVPRQYIPAVETGAREAMRSGPLGFAVVDVSVTLLDGQHHAVDSSDMAFRIAGRSGVSQALTEAGPVLLEPIFDVEFSVPSHFTGALQPIVSSKRGHVLGFDRDPDAEGWDVMRTQMPGPALENLIAELRSATQGVGRYTAEFSHYEELYGREAEKIVTERKMPS